MTKIDYSDGTLTEGNAGVITWENMANGDYGSSKIAAHIADKTSHVYGNFGAGGSVTLYGSNNAADLDIAPSAGTWIALQDSLGNELTFTAEGGDLILENYYYICAEVTAGDGTTDLTVSISAVS